ncbi:tetratricopeptide repeat protein [Ekhidna sp.]|uniref:tetratricopeptide repeat protein n=1 Tax=Ekhidna sp. TaxID=2608089 RepID=UPI003CCB95CD
MKYSLTLIVFTILLNFSYGQRTQELVKKIDSLFLEDASQEAFDLAYELVQNGNEDPLILHRLGMLYIEFPINQPQKALTHLQRAQSLTTDDSLRNGIHLDIAQVYYSMMKYDDALEKLEILLDQEYYRASALTISMSIFSDQGQYEKAIEIAREALALEPYLLPTIVNTGFLFLNLEQPDSALAYFERADELKPNDPVIINNIGFAYYKKGNLSKSLDLINESISIYPTNSYAYRNRAYVLTELDKIDEACNDINKAIELDYLNRYGDDILELKNSNCK